MPPLLEYILKEYGNNPFQALWFLLGHGGALIFIPIMIKMAFTGWLFWIQEKFKHHTKHVMYRIEVPLNNEQSMKAVEQIFVQLHGIYNQPDWYETWWLGFVQEQYSFEIVSDGGYITYYVRAPKYYKEMVQAAFYSHYPDAIMSEVEDYTKDISLEMINSRKVTGWGSEMRLEGDDVLPIKPYPAFEHSLAQKAVDPFANLLEFMSRLQPGEKLWYQIMIQPADLGKLKIRAQETIMNLVEPGKSGHAGPDIMDHVQSTVISTLQMTNQALFGGESAAAETHDDTRLEERQRMTKPEQEFVEEVDKKASRWPFHSKVRFMYFAPPAMVDSKKVRRGMLSGLRLYRYINSFTEGEITRTDQNCLSWRFVFPKYRVLNRYRRMYWAYKSRDMERGEHEGFILSTEEITALFHFPSIDVRAPYVAKAQSRGVEPPTLLRYDEAEASAAIPVQLEKGGGVTVKPVVMVEPVMETPTTQTSPATPAIKVEPEAPSNLPFV
ncbi:MAG: hypothetical protein WCV88_03085 [Patescibacteria group bacterium]|jgi:hypothetical protein